MGSFLRQNWPWIVVPVLLVVLALALLVLFGGPPQDGAEGIYRIF